MQAREVVVRCNERHFLGVVRVFVRAAHDTRIYYESRHNDGMYNKVEENERFRKGKESVGADPSTD